MEYSELQCDADKNPLGWILNVMLQSFNQSLGWSHPDIQKLLGNGE